MSRRKFLKSIGAAALGVGLGAAFSSRLFPVQTAYAHGSHEPVHIPGGTPVLGGGFHVFGPGTIDPIDAEPASITDFNGLVGIGFINGTVTRTNTQTGESVVLPTQASDMRFMKGEFRGMDGQFHNGTFGFVWVDVFEPGPGAQLHDLNPTTFPPTGLFWTIEIPDHSVSVNPGMGRAVMNANNVPIFDYHDIPNAIFGGGPAPIPGTVSFTVAWNGASLPVRIRNTDPVYGGFAGEFVRGNAQMEWSATVGDYQFVSAPLETSSSIFAEVGKERNGIFFNM